MMVMVPCPLRSSTGLAAGRRSRPVSSCRRANTPCGSSGSNASSSSATKAGVGYQHVVPGVTGYQSRDGTPVSIAQDPSGHTRTLVRVWLSRPRGPTKALSRMLCVVGKRALRPFGSSRKQQQRSHQTGVSVRPFVKTQAHCGS